MIRKLNEILTFFLSMKSEANGLWNLPMFPLSTTNLKHTYHATQLFTVHFFFSFLRFTINVI